MTDKQELLRQVEEHIADLELMVSLGEDRENKLEQALNCANTQYNKVVEQNKSLQQENKQLKAKNEELEKDNARFQMENERIRADLSNCNEPLEKLLYSQKQALDEIENVIECPLVYLDKEIYNAILDIINKAKEE